jgi:hypothetical protein
LHVPDHSASGGRWSWGQTKWIGKPYASQIEMKKDIFKTKIFCTKKNNFRPNCRCKVSLFYARIVQIIAEPGASWCWTVPAPTCFQRHTNIGQYSNIDFIFLRLYSSSSKHTAWIKTTFARGIIQNRKQSKTTLNITLKINKNILLHNKLCSNQSCGTG